MRIAGDTSGRQGNEIQYVRSVSLVSRWIHEMFEPATNHPKGGKAVVEPRGRTEMMDA